MNASMVLKLHIVKLNFCKSKSNVLKSSLILKNYKTFLHKMITPRIVGNHSKSIIANLILEFNLFRFTAKITRNFFNNVIGLTTHSDALIGSMQN